MEDIPRELEREIARSKPAPYKPKRRKQVWIVDELGEMTSGAYLKRLVRVLLITTVVGFLAAGVYGFLYYTLETKNARMIVRADRLDRQVQSLTREKEVLMARLAMAGADVSLDLKEIPDQGSSSPKDEPEQAPAVTTDQARDEGALPIDTPTNTLEETAADIQDVAEPESQPAAQDDPQDNEPPPDESDPVLDPQLPEQEGGRIPEKTSGKVAIEKFNVVRHSDRKNLTVRFDIRNISESPGEVSGRIFIILKPDPKPGVDDRSQWRVVPHSPLLQGLPIQVQKGQYFSIAHFKPVKFRIKDVPGQAFFTTAAILIFNPSGELMFKKDIAIEEE